MLELGLSAFDWRSDDSQASKRLKNPTQFRMISSASLGVNGRRAQGSQNRIVFWMRRSCFFAVKGSETDTPDSGEPTGRERPSFSRRRSPEHSADSLSGRYFSSSAICLYWPDHRQTPPSMGGCFFLPKPDFCVKTFLGPAVSTVKP